MSMMRRDLWGAIQSTSMRTLAVNRPQCCRHLMPPLAAFVALLVLWPLAACTQGGGETDNVSDAMPLGPDATALDPDASVPDAGLSDASVCAEVLVGTYLASSAGNVNVLNDLGYTAASRAT